ncbi:MAG: hypothetical protein LBD24_07930 [Spirochaetaceae bacterium]|nr:hypothetical protein [Spirochaetaceae bacterium]
MFETVGDGAKRKQRLSSSRTAHRTGCCTTRKQQAAMLKPSETGRAWAVQARSPDTVLHRSEATVFETAGGWKKG